MAQLVQKPLPASFAVDGFQTANQARFGGRKFRRLMIATEGSADTGKTEFILTCPGPGQVLCLDRGFDAMFDNPNPPPTRRSDFGFKAVKFSQPTQEQQAVYLGQWKEFRDLTYKAIANKDSLTVALDGDSDSWDIQRLAEHGKLHGVFPQTKYSDVYAARRGFYYRLWDSGKIIIATNKLKDEYQDVIDVSTGLVVKDEKGEARRQKTGNRIAQGFPDQEYLWQIRLRHLFKMTTAGPKWGIRILKAKADMSLVGLELWGEDCTFAGLVSAVYPHIPLAEWGL